MFDLSSLFRRRSPRIRVTYVTNRPQRLERLLVPRTVVVATLSHLKGKGDVHEEFAFWSGHIVDDRIGIVSRAFLPRTTHGRAHVAIDDDPQLLSMTDLVHEHNELVLCQLHTHPEDAFHSPADDHGAFTDESGFLSLVLPSFARPGLAAARVYRRTSLGWVDDGYTLSPYGLVEVFDDVVGYEGGSWRAR